MQPDEILIRGAKEHNLKDIDVRIPRYQLIVITGVSGSGKSSLAFDTLYAEGQRRYVESLSSYARQFIGQMEKPRVDYIGGLSPAIAIEQKAVSKNPRSTVGTVTEIYDYLRVLFARIGIPHCPQCGRLVSAQSAQEIVEQVLSLPGGCRYQILAPIARNRKGAFHETFSQARSDGYARVRVDGAMRSLQESIELDKNLKHTIELVVDRLVAPAFSIDSTTDEAWLAYRTRVSDSVETALKASSGLLVVDRGEGNERLLSEHHACPDCNISFSELTPQMFSFNSPAGMCRQCNGLGTDIEFDPDLFVDSTKTLDQGAIRTWGVLGKKKSTGTYQIAKQIVEQFDFDMDTPWLSLSDACRQVLLYGGVRVNWQSSSERHNWQGEWDFEGTINSTRRRYRQTKSEGMRRWYTSFMSRQPCPECGGQRLRPESSAVTLGDHTIHQVSELSIGEALAWVQSIWQALEEDELKIGEEVLKEVAERLQFLMNVGLHYLTLDRPAPTLSGGEGQRIRLASQIGCGLVGVLYVLDEPSIGLHARDNRRLLDTLERLRDMGNTVVVVEHDEETMHAADWIIDLGPGAGVQGGEVVACGTPHTILANKSSLTGAYLRGDRIVTSPNGQRRPSNGKWLTIVGARHHNLKNVTVSVPLGLFTCVTGVSGSGKSSLIAQTLQPALAQILHHAEGKPGVHDHIEGIDQINKIISITQDPIGRTPRSNPATYVQVMTHIRSLFALVPEAKARGYEAGRFSFNVKGGRCEACKGHGRKRVEMHFLPDVWVTCNVCQGNRFNRETLDIHYRGKNIADVLDMAVDEALAFFHNIPKVNRILQMLVDVGLSYVKLGQSATTLSGGEAQRVKLAKELARISTGDTLYILDEPTTGLHFADIQKLLDVLHRLTDAGNTVIVIEHNLDVVKTADWVIDLGPEGGEQGGHIVAEGPPESLSQITASYTGQFLLPILSTRTAGAG